MSHVVLKMIWFAAVATQSTVFGTATGLLTDVETAEETVVVTVSDQCQIVKDFLDLSYKAYAQNDTEPDVSKLFLVHYSSDKNISYSIVGAAEKIMNASWFNASLPTVFYSHGFLSSSSSDDAIDIVYGYIDRGGYNVLALDASALIGFFYMRATTLLQFAGEALGEVMVAMTDTGYNCDLFHLIGHSLGAHLVGAAGRTFYYTTGKKVGRITGLDPAGPCFTELNATMKLNKNDSTFVDVIHSDAGVFGIDENLGHVNFWPNDGSKQPGCLIDTCDHSRSWEYYAESITTPNMFIAASCSSWAQFQKGSCDCNGTSLMGFGCQPGTNGTYYLRTNTTSPYGLGPAGAEYNVNN